MKMGDAFRVGAYGIMNKDFKHLNKHWPISGISIEAWRLHAGWFNGGTTRRSVCGTKVMDPCIRRVNSVRNIGCRWRGGRTRETR